MCDQQFSFYNFHDIMKPPYGTQGRVVKAVSSGDGARLPPEWPGLNSWTRRHMWVEFVVGSRPVVLAPRVFLLVLRSTSLHKNQHFQIPIRSGLHGPTSL
ncbi:hypothetical protein ACROYT_G040987 [Oculina patagonica]